MELIILIAAILLIIFLGLKLRNIIAMILLLIIFSLTGLVFIFILTDKPFVLLLTFAAMSAIIFPIAYFQNKKEAERKAREDARGREIWLKAEEARKNKTA